MEIFIFKNSKIICFNFFFRGISVLNTKTELERAMEKRNRHSKEKQRQVEKEDEKTPFQKMLDDRAKRLEMLVRTIVFCFENCSDLFREKNLGIRKTFVNSRLKAEKLKKL